MEKKIFKTIVGGRPLICEIGEVAKQARGSVLISYGDTQVLSAVVAGDTPSEQDFFPLMVLYQEKLYAVGKIPGSFFKREGRSTEVETLISRLIDRPIRPLFPEGFRNEVQIINTVLSSDPDNSPAVVAMIGSSIALSISNIPFLGPIAGVEVGYIDGKYILNPTVKEKEQSSIDLSVAGTKDAINMVEAGSKEVDEKEMVGALMFGHAQIQEICKFIDGIVKEVGVKKQTFDLFKLDKDLVKEVNEFAKKDLIKAISTKDKLARYQKIDEITENTIKHFSDRTFYKTVGTDKIFDAHEQELFLSKIKKACEEIVRDEMRKLITVKKIRPDGRGVDEIRPLSSRVSVLRRTHGSALFTRGQTQALATVTLGALKDNQIIDGIGLEESKRFMLHYNFPQYSVGEVGRYGSPGRREVGHGHLGERALSQILPDENEFPYTIRVVSEILESNGSSSQATICAGTLALMDAGVPIKAPVAGIAMGLIKDGENYTILTDIQGMEDHEGDMDFKVAGTTKGIVALQMDIKISGITQEIIEKALDQAKKGRLQILEHMGTTITAPRAEMGEFTPKAKTLLINPDKIKDVIGSGGKTINAIVERNNQVKIDIEQTGRIIVMHMDMKTVDNTIQEIKDLTKDAEVGQIYEGTVVRILENVGAFVQLWKGTDGLCHISNLAWERIEKVEDAVKIGDTILVKVISITEKGIGLSRKETLPNTTGKTFAPYNRSDRPEGDRPSYNNRSNDRNNDRSNDRYKGKPKK